MNQAQYDALGAITGGIGGIGQALGTAGTMTALGGAAAALAPPVAFAMAAFSIMSAFTGYGKSRKIRKYIGKIENAIAKQYGAATARQAILHAMRLTQARGGLIGAGHDIRKESIQKAIPGVTGAPGATGTPGPASTVAQVKMDRVKGISAAEKAGLEAQQAKDTAQIKLLKTQKKKEAAQALYGNVMNTITGLVDTDAFGKLFGAKPTGHSLTSWGPSGASPKYGPEAVPGFSMW
jgi:hypothetical protein